MPIWKLEPLDPNDDCWIDIFCRQPLIVRARDEPGARTVAEVECAPLLGPPPGKSHGTSPWQIDTLSSCSQVVGTEYEEDGPDELLIPLGR